MKRVVIVTGTPGVGKSSISALLAARLNGLHVDLADLVKDEGLHCGFDTERGTLIADESRVSERVSQIIGRSEGYVIVDGHIAIGVVDSARVLLVLVLRRNPDELREVLKKKGFKERKVAENVAAEVLDVCLVDAVEAYGQKQICEVDVSGRTIAAVVDETMGIIEDQDKCRIGVVDWLAKLEAEGRLDEVFASL
jgi:adenylate kinase